MRQIQLPLAAEENLRQVLGFEMQRKTPFRAEQVFFDYRVTARRVESKNIGVQLWLVPRDYVENILNALADWDLVPDLDKGSNKAGVGIFPFVSSDAARAPSSRLNRLLVALNLALLGCAVAIPLVQQQRQLDQLRARFEEVREAATTASELQQQIDTRSARARYLFGRKSERPASVELLEELSRRLPDDTWLFRVDMRDGKVNLQGTSKRASSLIAALEDSHFLRGASFASPVTQDGNSGRERFHLSASVVVRPTKAAAVDSVDTGT